MATPSETPATPAAPQAQALVAGLALIERAQERRTGTCVCLREPCICGSHVRPAWDHCPQCAPRIEILIGTIDRLRAQLADAHEQIEELRAELAR